MMVAKLHFYLTIDKIKHLALSGQQLCTTTTGKVASCYGLTLLRRVISVAQR